MFLHCPYAPNTPLSTDWASSGHPRFNKDNCLLWQTVGKTISSIPRCQDFILVQCFSTPKALSSTRRITEALTEKEKEEKPYIVLFGVLFCKHFVKGFIKNKTKNPTRISIHTILQKQLILLTTRTNQLNTYLVKKICYYNFSQ